MVSLPMTSGSSALKQKILQISKYYIAKPSYTEDVTSASVLKRPMKVKVNINVYFFIGIVTLCMFFCIVLSLISIFYFSIHVMFSYSAFRLQECSIKSVSQSVRVYSSSQQASPRNPTVDGIELPLLLHTASDHS